MNTRFASLMTELFVLAGADESECFDEDVALLAIDGFDVTLTLLEDADQIMVSTVVAELPTENENLSALQARLLEGNLFFQETQGFTLAARKDTGVVLHAALPCAILDKTALSAAVGNLVTVAEYWRGICEGNTDEVPEEESVPVAETDMLRV